MTDEQILQFVKKYFKLGGIRDDGSSSEYYGDPDAFFKFARAFYEKGVWDGEVKGYYDATGGREND